jgi:hypothetical protein
MSKQSLSPDAQKIHDLFSEVHHELEQSDETQERSRDEPKLDTATGYESEEHFFRFLTSLKRLARTTGGKLAIAFTLLSFLIVLAIIPSFFGGDDKSPPLNDGGDAAAELDLNGEAAAESDNGEAAAEAGAMPTHAELAAQEEVPLTEGSWRFFFDKSEGNPMYNFVFKPDGEFYEAGADHNNGFYAVDGATVRLALVRVMTVKGKASNGSVVTEEVEWAEWFTMTRTGNTMTGDWEQEMWEWHPDDGFDLGDKSEREDATFARPWHPDDAS